MTNERPGETAKPPAGWGRTLWAWISKFEKRQVGFFGTVAAGVVVVVVGLVIGQCGNPGNPPTPRGPSPSPEPSSSASQATPPAPPIPVDAPPPNVSIVLPQDSPITVDAHTGPPCTVVTTPDGAKVDGDESTVKMNVQGKSDTSVVLTGMRVIVEKRSQPAGSVMGCHGIPADREFTMDLDQPFTPVLAQWGSEHNAPAPPVSLPLTVTAQDTEILNLTASTQTGDCTWAIELSWSANGRSGIYRIPSTGAPYRTIATGGL